MTVSVGQRLAIHRTLVPRQRHRLSAGVHKGWTPNGLGVHLAAGGQRVRCSPSVNINCLTQTREISEQIGSHGDQPSDKGPDARSAGFFRSMRLFQNATGTAMRVGEQTQEPNSTTRQQAELIASDETFQARREGRGRRDCRIFMDRVAIQSGA